jgi:hypothetical protein
MQMEQRKMILYDGKVITYSSGEPSVVYALCDPRDGTVRYIGITNRLIGRLNEHMRMYGGNERKNAWLRDLADAHMLPYMHTLEVLANEAEWRERELAWIEMYLENGVDLLNEEASKIKKLRETRNSIRIRLRLENHRARHHSKRSVS